MDIFAAPAALNVQSRCLLPVEWTFSRRQPFRMSKAGGESPVEWKFSRRQPLRKSKASRLRPKNGLLREAIAKKSPKQAACVRRMDFSEKLSPKKVQSKLPASEKWTFLRRQPRCRSKAGCLSPEEWTSQKSKRKKSPKQAASRQKSGSIPKTQEGSM